MGTFTVGRYFSAVNRGFFIGLIIAFLYGCSTSPDSGVGKAVDMAKGLVGMETAEKKAAKGHDVALQLFAAKNLNADAAGRGLAVVSRVYFLKDATAFEQIPRDVFEDAVKLDAALKQDIVAVREQVVVPGKQYQIKEKVGPEAKFLGVVALYRSTITQRWKLSLPLTELEEKKPLVIGLHRCVITVSDGLKSKELLNSLSVIGTSSCH